MRNATTIATLLGALLALPALQHACAAEFNSVGECTVGMRVSTRDGHKGTISRVDRAWSYCYVHQDDTGKEVGYLYSMLQPEGGAAPKGGGGDKLAVGTYTCWVGSEPSAAGLKITGPNTYESEGQKGKYRLEASGTIVFESGPYSSYHAKRLSNGRVGMNLSGGTFYNLACDPPK